MEKQGCWLWTGSLKDNGYGQLSRGRGKLITVHRYAWILTHGEIPPGLHVLHHCDVRHCGNPDHLYLGTDADNMRDMRLRNRMARGERLPGHILTPAQVVSIREEYGKGGISMKNLGAKHGVKAQTVCDVISGRRWKHI